MYTSIYLYIYISLQYDSRNKRWPASVATSPVFPGRPIEHTDGPDRANSRSFTKKPFYYWKINPQSLNPRLRPPLAPAPPPRLEDLSPPLRRAACRGSAPRHVLARAPAMAVGPKGRWRAHQNGRCSTAQLARDGARGGRGQRCSRTSRPPDPAAAATGRA